MSTNTAKAHSYQQDFYAWALSNAELIRQGRFAEADIEHIAEEIESMGKSDKRELINRLAVLMTHLLKWQYQSNRRSKSWMYTIKEQRLRLEQLLEESPSLKYEIEKKLYDAYELAVIMTIEQTGLDENHFSNECPFTLNNCLERDFLPDEN